MSEATNSLHRTTSVRTIHRNDCHKEGHLNIIATRHGWTRTLCISPDDVRTLDYATLEAVLELNTLRLRAQHLRIFVESPPHSGQFRKIRYWKDDESLQSVLVQQFFNQRMEEGTITTIDVRDGHDRDDTISVKSGISGSRFLPGALSRPGETKDWLRRRALNHSSTSVRSGRIDEEGEDGEHSPPQPQASRTQALMYFLGLRSEPPLPPPKTDEQIAAEARHEEDTLRKHGWMPPVLRRMTSRKSTKTGKTKIIASNPFFSSSERNLVRRRKSTKDVTPSDDADAENPQGNVENEELQDMDNQGAPSVPAKKEVQKETRWLRIFSAKNEEQNPFLGSKERMKGKTKSKVEIVGKPIEAFDHSPNASE